MLRQEDKGQGVGAGVKAPGHRTQRCFDCLDLKPTRAQGKSNSPFPIHCHQCAIPLARGETGFGFFYPPQCKQLYFCFKDYIYFIYFIF